MSAFVWMILTFIAGATAGQAVYFNLRARRHARDAEAIHVEAQRCLDVARSVLAHAMEVDAESTNRARARMGLRPLPPWEA